MHLRGLVSRLAVASLVVGGIGHVMAAAPVDDSMAQRVVACTACHGAQGQAAPDGYYPRIAGKPAGYLYNQLIHFKQGRRPYRLMAHMVEPLTDAYLREMADHFASLDLPYPAPVPAQASQATLRRGEELVRQGDTALKLPACTACHGTALMGVQPNTPGLLGLPRDYINSQLGAWRSGTRHAAAPDCMAHVARTLTPADVSALSAWLASQPLPTHAHPAPASRVPTPIECGAVPHPARQPS